MSSSTPTVSVVIDSINGTLRAAGAKYAGYSCKTVSWDDVTRGTVGGQLSCWGANITDTRLYAKGGQQLYTVRSDNFNEKLGRVSADELALIQGNNTPGGGALSPVTLGDFLKGMGKHASYAGVDAGTDLSAAADAEVSIRFMTTFLPVADEAHAALEFAPEMYQYQTRSDSDPANLLLLATTQGVAVQANGAGATKLYHHAVEPSGKICRYWFEAEKSEKKVGGSQTETKEEALEAAKRGKATAAVIGTRSMGTRFNVLMTIQVPLKQQPPPARLSAKKKGVFGGIFQKGAPGVSVMMTADSDEDWDLAAVGAGCSDEDEDSWSLGGLPPPPLLVAASASAPVFRCRRAAQHSAPPRVGKANAARVSRGTMVDKLEKTVLVKKPTRDPGQHVTVTVVIYNTVSGGVPSAEDVKAAVDDMEELYTSCGWKGQLADAGAQFMKEELTVKNVADIAEKLATQPYAPPSGAIGLVQGGDVFPNSSAA